MRVLLDHCVDVHFADLVLGHEVRHTKAMGWERLGNGKLMTAAEDAGFQVLITVDKKVRVQQNIIKRQISLITLNPSLVDFDYIAPMADRLVGLLDIGFPPESEIVIDQ